MINPDDEFYTQAKFKQRAEDSMSKWMARIQFIVWAVGGLGALLVAVITWAIFLRVDINREKEERAKLEKEITRIDGQTSTNGASVAKIDQAITLKAESDKRVYDGLKSLIDLNGAELKKREYLVKEVDEMWFMKEHGISNKEDFTQKHPGVPVPK